MGITVTNPRRRRIDFPLRANRISTKLPANSRSHKLMKTLCFVLLAIITQATAAQDIIKLDSLQIRFDNAKEDSVRVAVLLEMSHQHSNSNIVKAIEFARQAKQLAHEKRLAKFEAKSDIAMGNIAINQGHYKNASTHYFSALKYYESAKDLHGLASVNNNLGVTYDRIGDYDKALTHYFKVQEILNAAPHPNKTVLPAIYNNIANIYQTQGDAASALKYYEKGLSLALKEPLLPVRGQLYNNLGKLHLLDLNNPEKAFENLSKGLEVREQLGDKSEIARSLFILSEYYLQQKDFPRARELAIRALNIGQEMGSIDINKTAYFQISLIEEATGHPVEALAAHRIFKDLNDSIHRQQANREIAELQLQYDFEKAEKVKEEERKQTRMHYLLTIGVLSVLLTLAILITILIRTKARQTELKRKNLAQDIENKNKELTTNVMYLIRKNELLNNVAERLLQFEQHALPDERNKKVLQDIILDLQREADTDSWKEFELRFNQVHSEFYKNLRRLYPGLSPAEEKLCAFLRLNMSSKEIAAITQQSPKSVEVARARLRKKLNLTNTSSNLVTHLTSLDLPAGN